MSANRHRARGSFPAVCRLQSLVLCFRNNSRDSGTISPAKTTCSPSPNWRGNCGAQHLAAHSRDRCLPSGPAAPRGRAAADRPPSKGRTASPAGLLSPRGSAGHDSAPRSYGYSSCRANSPTRVTLADGSPPWCGNHSESPDARSGTAIARSSARGTPRTAASEPRPSRTIPATPHPNPMTRLEAVPARVGTSSCAITMTTEFAPDNIPAHVQGVRLNHTIFAREEGLVMR